MCIQGAVLVLLQFYSSTNNLFLSACWRHHQCHRDPRCCVVAFLQTCSFLVFLLEESSAAAPPKRSKVLCCCISSTNSFFVFLLEASSSAAAVDSSDSEDEARKIFHDQWNRQCWSPVAGPACEKAEGHPVEGRVQMEKSLQDCFQMCFFVDLPMLVC